MMGEEEEEEKEEEEEEEEGAELSVFHEKNKTEFQEPLFGRIPLAVRVGRPRIPHPGFRIPDSAARPRFINEIIHTIKIKIQINIKSRINSAQRCQHRPCALRPPPRLLAVGTGNTTCCNRTGAPIHWKLINSDGNLNAIKP